MICAYKSRNTYSRPYAYLDDLCSVRWHVTRPVAMARQAWTEISGGQQQKNLLKNSDAASKSCAFCSLPAPHHPPFHLFSDSAHVSTGDSDLHDVIGLCLFLQLFFEFACACVSVSCLSSSLFASVNAQIPTARKRVLQRKE